MTTEPDKDVELLALFVKGAMALHPNFDPDGDALEALASLESRIEQVRALIDTNRPSDEHICPDLLAEALGPGD